MRVRIWLVTCVSASLLLSHSALAQTAPMPLVRGPLQAIGPKDTVPPANAEPSTWLIGGGALSDSSGKSAAGAYFGFRHTSNRWYVSGLFNNGSIVDLPTDRPGAWLLSPSSDAIGFEASVTRFLSRPGASTAHGPCLRLAYNKATFPQAAGASVGVDLIAGFAGYRSGFRLHDDPAISFGVDAGIGMRWLAGEIGADSTKRQNLLGTTKTLFCGPELTTYFAINNFVPFARLSWYPASVDGLSDTRVTLGLNVLSDLTKISGR